MPNQASRSLMPLVAGNWKMNGVRANLPEIAQIRDQIGDCTVGGLVQVLICPPATLVAAIAEMAGDHLLIGGQDCHTSEAGAHTGDISAAMLRDAGASAVIVGHSERRTDHAETDGIVHAKATAAHQAGLLAIICVGETSAQRTAGTTLDVIAQQLAGSVPDGAAGHNTVVAYEPVWAIGTGLTPTSADVAEVHAFMRAKLCARFGAEGGQLRLLYGGSVKPSNATALLALPDVNGALVGGASLKAVDFLGIIAAYRR